MAQEEKKPKGPRRARVRLRAAAMCCSMAVIMTQTALAAGTGDTIWIIV